MKHVARLRQPITTEQKRERIGRVHRTSKGELEWDYHDDEYQAETSPDDLKVRSSWRPASPFLLLSIKQVAVRLMKVDIPSGRKFLMAFGARKFSDLDDLSDAHITTVTEAAEEAFIGIPPLLAVKIGLSELIA